MTAALLEPPAARGAVSRWGEHVIVLGLVAVALMLLFARDVGDMGGQWLSSSAYEHCLVVPPVIAWLVWRRRDALAQTPPRAWPLALIVVAVGGAGWLLGAAAAVAAVRQFALLVMIEGAVLALTGPAVARLLAFPLGYAIFLVPAGDMLIPPLQTITARFCLALLGVVGIPATLSGVFLHTPDGWFEVAAACSGVKFLIAMVALGVLAAHLCFRSWPRRIAFLAACVVVPVLANGVRAWATLYMAHFVGAARATDYDHIIYGWFFFGTVIALMLGLAWPFFDRDPGASDARPIPGPAGTLRGLVATAAGTLLLATMAPAWAGALAAVDTAPLPETALPAIPGWHLVAPTGEPWRPRFDGADRFVTGRYADAAGHSADLAIAVYASQDQDRRLVGYGHGAVDPASGWAWAHDLPAPPSGKAELILGPNQVTRTVLSFYRVGRITTGSEVAVKIETLKTMLLGGPRRATALLISADDTQGGRASADALLAAIGQPTKVMDTSVAR